MRYFLILFGVLGGVIPATAQTTDPESTSSSTAPVVEEVLVVTGTSVPESASRLPVSVDVVGREELDARQVNLVADALRAVPGLDVVRSGGPGKVTSLFTRGTESDHTLVLFDGIQLNNPFFGGFDWAFLPTDDVAQIEVARGPFSALYGSDAIGGVVQIVSESKISNRAKVEVGGNDYLRGQIGAGREWGNFKARVGAHVSRTDGELDNDFFDAEELSIRGDWRSERGSRLGLMLRRHDAELGIPFASGMPAPNRETEWSESEVAVPWAVAASDWQFEGQVSHVSYDSTFSDPDDIFGFTGSQNDSTVSRARAQANYQFGDRGWIAFGTDYEEQEVDSSSVFGVDLQGEQQDSLGFFSQALFTVGQWRFDLGARQDDHSSFGSVTSPHIAVAWQPTQATRVRVSLGEGFRAPSIGELFFPFSGNPDLEPEESESVELSFDHSTDHWQTTLNLFSTEVENLIDFDFFEGGNINVGRATMEGAELQVGRRWSEGRVRWNVSFLETEDRANGLELLRRPEWRSSLVGDWSHESWGFTATGLYVGDRPDVSPVTFLRGENDSYTRLDLAVRYDGWTRWTPQARVENLTDEDYAEVLGFPAPGIVWVLGVGLSF